MAIRDDDKVLYVVLKIDHISLTTFAGYVYVETVRRGRAGCPRYRYVCNRPNYKYCMRRLDSLEGGVFVQSTLGEFQDMLRGVSHSLTTFQFSTPLYLLIIYTVNE